MKNVQYCKRCGAMYYGKSLARMCRMPDCHGDLASIPEEQPAAVPCPACDGYGVDSNYIKCHTCKGTGMVSS